MRCREIFDAAIRVVCEDVTSTEGLEDYADRAPYLLATFLSQCAPIDKRYRKVNGLSPVTYEETAAVNMEADFPLCSVFFPAAIYYLSAMLVIDESETLSDKFFSLYTDAIVSIQADLACMQEQIVDRYGLNK
ncbi:MAG: hypothetical protein IJX13_03165 [Clostridia bacterium]|nr:hypothetical protein [Clostridia bacterium]